MAHAARVERDDDDDDDDDDARRADGAPTVGATRGRVRLFKTQSDDGCATTTRRNANAACVVGVPSAIAIADFCRFVAGAMATTRSVRAVAGRGDGARSTYDAVLEFDDGDAADAFVENYHGRKYAMGREETCVAVRVVRVEEGEEASGTLGTEVPTCPVCLDRLDAEASGIVTTICEHAFHAECLSGWADASCPVCRYAHEPESKARCATCGKDHDLWVCLICGEVRCGRYAGACAVNHWTETNHTYALELGTQRVWDYVSDGFVHRLIQSKSGLVELTPPPSTRRASSSDASGAACSPIRAPDVGDLDAQLEEALVASKLDAIASEYDLLLTSQLESQRKYFEGLLQTANARCAGTISREDEDSRNAAVVARAMSEAKDAKRELKMLQKANASHVASIEQLRDELEHAHALSDTLAENVETLRAEATRAEKRKTIELAIKDARIKELEEENRDLMLFLDTSNKLSVDASLAEEIAGGTVVGIDTDTTPEPTPSRNRTHERLKGKVEAERRKL